MNLTSTILKYSAIATLSISSCSPTIPIHSAFRKNYGESTDSPPHTPFNSPSPSQANDPLMNHHPQPQYTLLTLSQPHPHQPSIGSNPSEQTTMWPFPTQTEIQNRIPPTYGSTPETQNKNPLEDPTLRPLGPYNRLDNLSGIAATHLLRGRDQYLSGSINFVEEESLAYSSLSDSDFERQQSIRKKELVMWGADKAWEWATQNDLPLAKTINEGRSWYREQLTWGSWNAEPRIEFQESEMLTPKAISLGLETTMGTSRIGPGKLFIGIEYRNDQKETLGEEKGLRLMVEQVLQL